MDDLLFFSNQLWNAASPLDAARRVIYRQRLDCQY
jgi:hypothetical protein